MATISTNAFTVDLEDWYHGLTSTNKYPGRWPLFESRVSQNTQYLLKLLAEYQIKATFFVLGAVAARFPKLVEQIAEEGHEIGVHGYAHQMVNRLTPTEFRSDLERTLALLRPLVQTDIIGFRAPYFSINGDALWAVDILFENGFRYDSSFFPTRNMLYGYPGAPRFPHRLPTSIAGGQDDAGELTEFPASTVRFLGVTWPVAGGFYLRALPYSLVRQAITHLNRQEQPAIIYMHPWELDTKQPMRAATLRERITHYHGRNKLETKLRYLFKDFKFSRLRDLLESMSVV